MRVAKMDIFQLEIHVIVYILVVLIVLRREKVVWNARIHIIVFTILHLKYMNAHYEVI